MADAQQAVPSGDDSGKQNGDKKRARPTKTLPTDRITFSKQLEILRAYGALSGTTGNAVVSNNDVADALKMQPSTISLANPFFYSIALLQKTEGGCIPSSHVVEMHRAKEWTPETATHKLAPAFRESWFGQALIPRLSVAPMTEQDAIAKLADACVATLDYRPQLRMLIDYLASTGLVERDGDQLKIAKSSDFPTVKMTEPVKAATERDSRSNITTGFAQTPEGAVNFHIAIRVEMAEFAGWQPQRIAAFFNGIAAVLAAKANVEQKG